MIMEKKPMCGKWRNYSSVIKFPTKKNKIVECGRFIIHACTHLNIHTVGSSQFYQLILENVRCDRAVTKLSHSTDCAAQWMRWCMYAHFCLDGEKWYYNDVRDFIICKRIGSNVTKSSQINWIEQTLAFNAYSVFKQSLNVTLAPYDVRLYMR